MKKSKPNILFFFTDQQRADTCGCYGGENNLTPNLDKLAKDGILYKNAFSCQPVCGPARSVIQTGLYATNNGCYRNDIALSSKHKTIAHYLKEGGYYTGYIGKWHLSRTGIDPVLKHQRGGYEDYWIAADLLEFTSEAYNGYLYDENNEKITFENRYRVDAITDQVEEFIKVYNEESPFFMFVSYLEPHHQNTHNRYIAPNGYAELYKDAKVPKDLTALDKPDADWRDNIADYFGCIKRLDEALGRIIQNLKDSNMYEDTIIIFTSDHGSHFRTRNGEYKRSCHEASIKIPMVIGGGATSENVIYDSNVSLIDMAPTILDFAGIKIPNEFEGKSFKSINETKWKNDIFIQISESEVGRAIRTKKYKYGVTAPHKDPWRDSYSDVYVERYLYDLEKDPYELENLIDNNEYKKVKNELMERLVDFIVRIENYRPEIKSLD